VTVVDADGNRTDVDTDRAATLELKGGRFDVLMSQGSTFNVTTSFDLVADEPDEIDPMDEDPLIDPLDEDSLIDPTDERPLVFGEEPLEPLSDDGGSPGLPGNSVPPDTNVPGTSPGANNLSAGLP
jgi:hypothetical protein